MAQTTAKPGLLGVDSEPMWEALKSSCNRSQQTHWEKAKDPSSRRVSNKRKIILPHNQDSVYCLRLNVELKYLLKCSHVGKDSSTLKSKENEAVFNVQFCRKGCQQNGWHTCGTTQWFSHTKMDYSNLFLTPIMMT